MPRRKRNDYTYRPYDPEFHPQDLINRMAKGELNVQVYAEWNISEDSFYRWRKEHPELEQAYQLGLAKFEKWFIENRFNPMIEGTLQGRHAFQSAIAIANNKLGWKQGTKGGEGNTTNTQININNVNVMENKSTQELLDAVKQNVGYLINTNTIDAEIVESADESYREIEDQSGEQDSI